MMQGFDLATDWLRGADEQLGTTRAESRRRTGDATHGVQPVHVHAPPKRRCVSGDSGIPLPGSAGYSTSIAGGETMEIYADPITVNSRKVLAGLKFLDVGYTLVHVDYFQSKQ